MKSSVLALAACLAIAGCTQAGRRLTRASYDPNTSKLILLSADQNGDGVLDQWTYLDGNRPLRGEGDTDGDGRIDRWEYFDASAQLTQIGTSSANDGIEDTWTWVVPVNGEARIDRSQRRDRQIDRREFYRGDILVRVEEDMNADGLIDKWERLDSGRLVEVAFDTTLSRGRPDRRMTYDAEGRVQKLEVDIKGDGKFVPVPAQSALPDKDDAR